MKKIITLLIAAKIFIAACSAPKDYSGEIKNTFDQFEKTAEKPTKSAQKVSEQIGDFRQASDSIYIKKHNPSYINKKTIRELGEGKNVFLIPDMAHGLPLNTLYLNKKVRIISQNSDKPITVFLELSKVSEEILNLFIQDKQKELYHKALKVEASQNAPDEGIKEAAETLLTLSKNHPNRKEVDNFVKNVALTARAIRSSDGAFLSAGIPGLETLLSTLKELIKDGKDIKIVCLDPKTLRLKDTNIYVKRNFNSMTNDRSYEVFHVIGEKHGIPILASKSTSISKRDHSTLRALFNRNWATDIAQEALNGRTCISTYGYTHDITRKENMKSIGLDEKEGILFGTDDYLRAMPGINLVSETPLAGPFEGEGKTIYLQSDPTDSPHLRNFINVVHVVAAKGM